MTDKETWFLVDVRKTVWGTQRIKAKDEAHACRQIEAQRFANVNWEAQEGDEPSEIVEVEADD